MGLHGKLVLAAWAPVFHDLDSLGHLFLEDEAIFDGLDDWEEVLDLRVVNFTCRIFALPIKPFYRQLNIFQTFLAISSLHEIFHLAFKAFLVFVAKSLQLVLRFFKIQEFAILHVQSLLTLHEGLLDIWQKCKVLGLKLNCLSSLFLLEFGLLFGFVFAEYFN